jgi:transposase
MQITTIGLDIAKNVFQIDAAEKVVIRKQLRRGQVLKFFASLAPCLVGMKACASAHYWGAARGRDDRSTSASIFSSRAM